MFTYDVPGQNTDIRGVLRYSNAQDPPMLPVATMDPGSVKKLAELNDTMLVPAVVDTPPNSTRLFLLISFLADFLITCMIDGTLLPLLSRTQTMVDSWHS